MVHCLAWHHINDSWYMGYSALNISWEFSFLVSAACGRSMIKNKKRESWMKELNLVTFFRFIRISWFNSSTRLSSDVQLITGWPFSTLNAEQMSNWLGAEHWPSYLHSHHGRIFLFFYVWFDPSYGRPLAVDSEMWKWLLLKPQKPTSGHGNAGRFCSQHCFFFPELWQSRVKGLVPWPQPWALWLRKARFLSDGVIHRPREPHFSLKNWRTTSESSDMFRGFLVSKEVATEEFVKILKVCFLWLFVLTGVCCSKLEFWVREGTPPYLPTIREGPTGPWQQTRSKHDYASGFFG